MLIKNRIAALLKKHRVAGYQTRQIPYTEWHVVRVTTRVLFKDFKPEREKPPCRKCGRGAWYGIPEALRHIAVPKHDNTLFAPAVEATNGYEVYMTDTAVQMLKANRAKGVHLTRLLDDDEYRLMCEGTPAARGKIKNWEIHLT